MNKNTLLLIVVIFIFLLPSNEAKTEVKLWTEQYNKFELMENEGFCACLANSQLNITNENVDEKIPCECNGTGHIRTGDNRLIPCPGTDCKAKKSGSNIELILSEDNIEKKNTELESTVQDKQLITDISQLDKKVIVFTNPEWCVPCKQLENTTFKELKNAGFKFDSLESDSHITTLDETHPLYEKLKMKTIPTFIFIKDGKIVKTVQGYQQSRPVSIWINELWKN